MNIAVLSGKGGTGKTLVAVNLAAVAGRSVYIDCDVEEPNGHLFFLPKQIVEQAVCVKIPFADETLCDACRRCVDFCRFNALALIQNKPIVFEEVCHSCGGCLLVCPKQAFSEKEKVVGRIQRGVSGDVSVHTGILNEGEASGIPIIRALLSGIQTTQLPCFIDCPPGSACIVMESIREADYCILVAEPTRFGVHNLQMVHELVKLFGKPHGAVLNKCLDGDNPAGRFCAENGITVLGSIPFDGELGAYGADAAIAARESKRFCALFSNLLQSVRREVQA